MKLIDGMKILEKWQKSYVRIWLSTVEHYDAESIQKFFRVN